MQRQRRKHEAVDQPNVPSKTEGDFPGVSPTRTAPIRTNSKIKQSQKRGVLMMILGIPSILCAILLYCTTRLHRGDWEHPDAVALNKAAPQRDLETATEEVSKYSGGFEYHIVFSTGCSLYQDWQSYVFFYQAMMSKQPGTITRIVSGCDSEKDEEKMRTIFNEEISPMAPDRFKIHITPDYSKLPNGKSFVYFNKPFGMKHWLEHVLGFPGKPENEDAIVILVDPDQLILRPFRNNDFSNTDWAFIKKGQKPYTKIEHGKPMGQLYGFGLQWKNKIKNMTKIAPNSPVEKLTYQQAQAGYIVGPPYVATARDMYKIVSTWSSFARPVHEQYPFLLAEMFAYCLAAAHIELPHQTARSFMVSDVFTGKMEGWRYIDSLPKEQVCGGYTEDQVPNVLHFCQRYGMGKFFFGKRKLPKDFLTCESPLLSEPPHDVLDKYKIAIFPGNKEKTWSPEMAKRNAFAVCLMLPVLNAAATYYKQAHCSDDKANYSKSLIFFDSLDMPTDKK